MSEFFPINLKQACNCKIVYDRVPADGERAGLDNIYLLKSDYKIAESDEIDGVPFKFVFGDTDNVQCEGQVVQVGETADTFHFIGFAYWGSTNEMFRVEYADGSCENIDVPFIDWSLKHKNYYSELIEFGENIRTVKTMISSGAMVHLMYMHHITIKLKKCAEIKNITFPDNFLIHVFAVTAEKSDNASDIR